MRIFSFLHAKEAVDDPEYFAYLVEGLTTLRTWSSALAKTMGNPDKWSNVFDETVKVRKLSVRSVQTEPPKALRRLHNSLDYCLWAVRDLEDAQMAYFTALATQGPEGLGKVLFSKAAADKAADRMQKRFSELDRAIWAVVRSGQVNDQKVTRAASRLFGWQSNKI